jgi:hypothetical protein
MPPGVAPYIRRSGFSALEVFSPTDTFVVERLDSSPEQEARQKLTKIKLARLVINVAIDLFAKLNSVVIYLVKFTDSREVVAS